MSHWRYTSNEVKVLGIDARAFIPFAMLWVVKSWKLLILGVIFLVFFFILQMKGLNFPNFVRKLRTRITGRWKELRRYR